MTQKRLFACGLTLALGSFALAQDEAPTRPLRTIEELVTQALANNAELRVFEAELAAAKGQRTQAAFFKNPEISTEIGARQVRDSENILQGDGTTFSIAVTQTFEFPGKGTLRKAIANKNIEIAELGLEQFRLALAGQVRLLAYEHLAAVSDGRSGGVRLSPKQRTQFAISPADRFWRATADRNPPHPGEPC